MPWREKKIYSGKMLEVEIYPITKKQQKEPRKKKEKLSKPKQKNLNEKNARKHLIRLINTNFTDKDLAVHLTYKDGELPATEEEARKDVINYIRRIKRHRKKEGLPDIKYIAVIEHQEEEEPAAGKRKKRIHHHIIMSGMDRDTAEEIWQKGRANADRLEADEFGYEGIARYITKDPKGKKRWTSSLNLKKPRVDVNDHKYSRKKVDHLSTAQGDRDTFNKLYPGYYLNDCTVTVNDVTAAKHLHIRMRKIE